MVAIKVDENLPLEATVVLQKAGFDAMSVHDQKMDGSTDATIADVCKAEQRAIVTLDLDFADILAYPPEDYFGLIILRLDQQDKQHVVNVLTRLVPKIAGGEELIGKLWIVNEQTIRIRG
ncbi:MAG TPA: DUF5615 family PIN-like protein [Planctomycetaceae bacterium]|nr:DUF5615 family PIN-like protein [Planctomycetaceae bacterium]